MNRRLPVEVQLAVDVMPCQAMRRVHESAEAPHPCSWFGRWGVYHSYDYVTDTAPAEPGIAHDSVYVGKRTPVPELLSGCRKAPILAVGINPNLPGYWERYRSFANPSFDDLLQYAHYFRYRAIDKLQIPTGPYLDRLAGRTDDGPGNPRPLAPRGSPIPLEGAPQLMYVSYQKLLDRLAERLALPPGRLAVGEDLAYGNMVACASARWRTRTDPDEPGVPLLDAATQDGIVKECFFDRKYFLRQLFQSLPAVVLVFSQTTRDAFIRAMEGRFTVGAPQQGEALDALLARPIRLSYGVTSSGRPLDARVVFSPHASANHNEFAAFVERIVDILIEEVEAGRLGVNPATGHLRRPAGGCRFCANELYRIGPCGYEAELVPLADPGAGLASAGGDPTSAEAAEHVGLLERFLAERRGEPPRENEAVAVLAAAPSPTLRVLAGRVVTMDAARTVIPDGRVYLAGDRVRAVLPAAAPPPPGFGAVSVTDTSGTIYPGLLDLHNHLPYNVLRLWVPPRAYANRYQWRGHPSYRSGVRAPMGVLAKGAATARSIARVVECKALIGGATTVQGMRSVWRGIEQALTGMTRNFEVTGEKLLPGVGTRLDVPAPDDLDGLRALRANLSTHTSVLVHVAEGIDLASGAEYDTLRLNQLVDRKLLLIHALGLREQHWEHLALSGAGVVWSPTSNLALYGATLDPARLRDLPGGFALGCDWAPSGGKNLLEELKVAFAVSRAAGMPLTAADLCASVTCHPAAMVGWAGQVGVVAADAKADLLVVTGASGDPFEHLIRATERDVRLVILDGRPAYGDPDLMDPLGVPVERVDRLRIGGVDKRLHLPELDPALGRLTLTEACSTLRAAMADLRGAQDATLADAFDPDAFALVLDIEDDGAELAGSEDPLPANVELDPLAVGDEADRFERMGSIAHFPRDVLLFLREAYG